MKRKKAAQPDFLSVVAQNLKTLENILNSPIPAELPQNTDNYTLASFIIFDVDTLDSVTVAQRNSIKMAAHSLQYDSGLDFLKKAKRQ